jgi:hypothetical protein
MRQRTTKSRRHRYHVKVLKSEVMSPRIAWFNFLGALRTLTKVTVVLGLLLAVTYGIRAAIEHTFHRNPDFQLKAINLNPNDVLDESALVQLLEIDLSANIFAFDVEALEAKLTAQPAIASAKITRNLPGTLDFLITTRKPAAWISCPEEGFPATRSIGSLLVDTDGYVYRCPDGQADAAQALPILLLSGDEEHPIHAGKILDHPQYTKTLRLLKTIVSEHPDELPMINTISQANAWSLMLATRGGTAATFGLDDHDRQLRYLRSALDHARRKGYEISTINLIPTRNVPITRRTNTPPPRAILVVGTEPESSRVQSQTDGLQNLPNRN